MMDQYLYIGSILFLSFTILVSIILLIFSKKKNLVLEKRLANREEIANESYVRFLNESRNTAYEYIEDVQDKLINFAKRVEPQLDYHNTYGTAVQGPHTILVKELSEAYEELKTIMPENNKEK
jgi:hypothetical protein